MKTFILVISLLFISAFSHAETTDQALQKIVTDFDEAIKTKNKTMFLNLFYSGTVSWVGVMSDKEMVARKSKVERAKANGERARKPFKNFESTPEKFIDGIIRREKNVRETFENVKILHDGEVASIYFDYEFYEGDKRKNWGKEGWLLVKTDNGWKINSVIFSITRG